MDNQRYFYISGIISLTLFALFLSIFIMMLFQVKDIKSYGLKKENYISVSITLENSKSVKKTFQSSSPTIVSSKIKTSKNIDVNNLFSDVWTQKISHKIVKRKVNSKRINEIQKQIKLKENNKVQSIEKSFEKLHQIAEDSSKSNAPSTANEVNEYLAKIQSIVYQHFRVPANSEGNSVKTVIELDPFGKMIDFRVLNYSSNEALNSEVDKIKERLQNVVFPLNPEHKSSKTIVILISKE